MSNNNLENLIYFGVALDGVDTMDFSTDFFAGIRANYFSSQDGIKPELSYIKVKGMGYTFFHNIKKGEGMMWELYRKYERGFSSGKGELLQKSCQCDYNTYCIDNYSKLGFVFKKQYFDINHNWVKTEYFRNNDNVLFCVLKPIIKNSVPVIEKTIIIDGKETPFYLYPSTNMPQDKKYSALAYTNKGFVFYLNATDKKISVENSNINYESSDVYVGKKLGFNLKPDDFITPSKGRMFDITKAPYLNCDAEENIEDLIVTPTISEAVNPEHPLEMDFSYKDDKTQSILNELEKITSSLLSSSDEINLKTETIKDADETAINVSTEKTPDMVDIQIPEEKYIAFSEEKPDSVIQSGGEQYNFYGTIINGKRQGHGRTTTSTGTTAYDGYYVDDKRNGFGAFYYKNGDINYLGNWENNKRNGFGIGFRNTDFTAHIGKWINNIPTGVGARFDNNGDFLFLGEFIDGKKQGHGISRDDNDKFVVSRFEDDKVVSSYALEDIFPHIE